MENVIDHLTNHMFILGLPVALACATYIYEEKRKSKVYLCKDCKMYVQNYNLFAYFEYLNLFHMLLCILVYS